MMQKYHNITFLNKPIKNIINPSSNCRMKLGYFLKFEELFRLVLIEVQIK